MLKSQWVEQASQGLLHLWDNEFSGWDKMSKDHQLDWMYFFDICKEESPTIYTEQIINGISSSGLSGFCPYKKRVTQLNPNYTHSWAVRLATPENQQMYLSDTIWFFKITKEQKDFFSFNFVPDLPRFQPKYFLEGDWMLEIDASHGRGGYRGFGRRRREARKNNRVYKFDHIQSAWKFLFNLM